MKIFKVIGSLFLLLMVFSAQAQTISTEAQNNAAYDPAVPESEAIATDRPAFTMNANTLRKNTYLLQMGFGTGKLTNYEKSNDFNTFAFPIELRYGITNRLEAMAQADLHFAGWNYVGATDVEYGLQNYGFGLRYNIFNHGLYSAPKAKNYGSLSAYLGYNALKYEGDIVKADVLNLKLLYKIDVVKWLTIAANVGYGFVLNDVAQDAAVFNYTFNLSTPIGEKFGFYIENYGSETYAKGISTGLTWRVAENFQVDGFLGRGQIGGYEQYFGALGFSYRFGKYYRQ